MGIINKYKLEIIVFLGGACGMVLELVGSRVIAPYFGNSLIVWTSLIGVILGSLSLGYFWGGKIADKQQTWQFLSKILILASIFVALTAFFKELILGIIMVAFGSQIELASILAVTILFAPASVMLGIVSPYAAKLKLNKLNTSGSVVGNLYAISTVGSIVGTFLAGFFFIPFFGNTNILYMISFVLILAAFLAYFGKDSVKFLWLLPLIAGVYFLSNNAKLLRLTNVVDLDTQYGRIIVRDKSSKGRTIRYLMTDNSGWESAIYLDDPNELVFDYTKAYRLSNDLGHPVNSALMIGGAAYTYPRDFLLKNPTAKMDVVEIDSRMTEVAKKYFFLTEDPRMKIIHEDARTFVKKADKKYDVVFLDAFMGVTPPPHLTTKEFMSDIKNLLTDNGVLMINLISGVEGKRAGLFIEEANTLRTLFPYLDVYMVQARPLVAQQNLLFVAYKDSQRTLPKIADSSLSRLLSQKITIDGVLGDGSILTDDHTPVEYLSRYSYE